MPAKLVKLLVNDPVPVPSVNFVVLVVRATVGAELVLQQTPLSVTVAPPSAVIMPPLVAVVEVINDIDVVVSVGNPAVARVVNVISDP